MEVMTRHGRLPVGAEILPEGGVRFRVWAPRCRAVEVVIEGGWWSRAGGTPGGTGSGGLGGSRIGSVGSGGTPGGCGDGGGSGSGMPPPTKTAATALR